MKAGIRAASPNFVCSPDIDKPMCRHTHTQQTRTVTVLLGPLASSVGDGLNQYYDRHKNVAGTSHRDSALLESTGTIAKHFENMLCRAQQLQHADIRYTSD